MRLSRALATLLGAALLSLALASVAFGAKPVQVSCGETITEDTKLANDLANCPGNGLVIGADDITLDLNGHTIDGDGAAEDFGIDNTAGHDGVTIKAGSLTEFALGVLVAQASDNRLRDLSVADSHHAGIAVVDHSVDVGIEKSSVVASAFGGIVIENESSNVRVEKSKVAGSGLSGVAVIDSSDVRVEQSSLTGNAAGVGAERSHHLLIERNSASGNAEEGILLQEGSSHSVIRNNSASGNAAGVVVVGGDHNVVTKNSLHENAVVGVGLLSSDDNLVAHNSVVGNGNGEVAGIGVGTVPDQPGTASERNLIAANTLIGNDPDGILVLAGQSENVIEGNRSNENSDDGIDVDSPATTLTRNTANRNHDLGIEAVPGVTDGGGNKASGNGNPLQCANVFCK